MTATRRPLVARSPPLIGRVAADADDGDYSATVIAELPLTSSRCAAYDLPIRPERRGTMHARPRIALGTVAALVLVARGVWAQPAAPDVTDLEFSCMRNV